MFYREGKVKQEQKEEDEWAYQAVQHSAEGKRMGGRGILSSGESKRAGRRWWECGGVGVL